MTGRCEEPDAQSHHAMGTDKREGCVYADVLILLLSAVLLVAPLLSERERVVYAA